MRFIKRRRTYLKENTLAPSRPKIAPPIEKPVRPVKPQRKDRKIEEPRVKPEPKALEELSLKVSYTFIAEMSKTGESVEKYLK